jgi:hypothetical protein
MLRKVLLGLALTAVTLFGTACFSINQGQGNISLSSANGGPAALFALHANISQVLSNVYWNNCQQDITCFTNAVAGQNGNDFISNEALTDCNHADNGVCGYDLAIALHNRALVCPGGAFCGGNNTEWQSRCLAFEIADDNPISSLLNWNINGAYFVYGSWGWFRQGNGGCV